MPSHFHPRSRLLPVILTLAVGGLALAACGAMSPHSASVPDALQPAPAHTAAFTLAARGVQIYECRAGSAGAGPAWAFVAPEADLYDRSGRPTGTHGAGPFWRAADGSRIDGAVKARTDAPVPGAIPWLLLVARPRPGNGLFAPVTHVQRVNTAGGLAPSDGCNAATIGAQRRVPYTADYTFFIAIERNPT